MSRVPLEQIGPPFGLRITAGDLQLTAIREGDLPDLVGLVLDGIHDPAHMPFLFPWTDAPADELPANYMRYFGRMIAAQTPETTNLELVVRRGDQVVGIQALEGNDFPVTRTLQTGSWLARRFHGHGIGTRMRQAVCAFAFDHLGAERITSSAFLDNPASLAVSRKVGYQPSGRQWVSRRGQPAEQQRLLLTPDTFVRGDEILVDGATELRRFLGLA